MWEQGQVMWEKYRGAAHQCREKINSKIVIELTDFITKPLLIFLDGLRYLERSQLTGT